jgi:hypothetical protein
MFDNVTSDLIAGAPPLPGLDPATLKDDLTTAYVEIAAARLRVGSGLGADDHGELSTLADRMGRLADTYETEIVLDVHPERRRSMAFVAGSARQVLAHLNMLRAPQEKTTTLDSAAIGAELAAALLFLIAERSSDAYEASRDIRAAGEPNPLRRILILSVGRFARGQFQDLLDTDLEAERSSSTTSLEYAVDLLYRELLKGLMLLARAGLGVGDAGEIEQARAMFARVRELSIANDSLTGFAESPLRSTSVFAGPHHLAALLERAAGSFQDSALVLTPTPAGADPAKWNEWLRSEAGRWPFLWENHRDAIATGYLDQGGSLVMTTPTGSGKSTLAALKIVATLAAGRTVLYLAPTHALVGQIEDDLNRRVVGLAKVESIETVNPNDNVQALPDVAVVTPERCFALLTFTPELFSNVGLIVFDEFHLLGVSRPSVGGSLARVDRRGIDAMLCLLRFQATNSNSDFLLLSAMVSNGAAVAEWLSSLIQRPVIPFDYKWKPTRQLRSCLLYDKNELDEQARAVSFPSYSTSPAAVPFGLFSLMSGWLADAPDKLLIRPFAAEAVPLGVGKKALRRWLTANRYEVASELAKKFAASGLKVIVFCESIVSCGSVAKAINKAALAFPSTRDAEQDKMRREALAEVGQVEAIYDAGTTVAAVHHGELLPPERRLVETSFKKRDSGVNVLAATSTLAQGLNLPCDVVIVAASDRLDDSDPEEKIRVPLMPHEILNALGRAGRAGQAATGFAVVIPGSPLGFDMQSRKPNSDEDLKVIFADGDQCLPLEDPIATLFDQIQVYGVATPEAEYLVRRLSVSLGEEREGIETFESITRRTLGYFQRKRASAEQAETWLEARRAMFLERLAEQEEVPSLPWQEELAAKAGVSPKFIAQLTECYDQAPFDSADAAVWVKWLLAQLRAEDPDTDAFLRQDTIIRVFGRAITTQSSETTKRRLAIDGTLIALEAWFAGKPLIDVEKTIATFVAGNEIGVKRPTGPDSKGKRARRFALRLAPDLGYLGGVFNQIAVKISEERNVPPPPMPGFLSQLTRFGYRTPYHFALARDLDERARARVEQAFVEIESQLDRNPEDDWTAVRQKLERAQLANLFEDLDSVDMEAILQQLSGD